MRSPPEEDLRELLQRGFRYALSLTHDRSRADDLLQEAWVAVLRARGPRRRGYLFSAIRSRFIDHCRRERLVIFETLTDANALGTEDCSSRVEDEAQIRADCAMLDRALARLRPTEREVLLLGDVEGYTAQEIAELTGRPRGTVLSLIHRTRRKLRALLEPSEKKIRRHE